MRRVRGTGGGTTKAHEKTSEVIDMFDILIVVMILKYLHMLKLTKLYILNIHILLYVNYTSMELSPKKIDIKKKKKKARVPI